MSDRPSDKAPEPDVEITPAMIEAGLAELYRFTRDTDEVACLKQIYLAMVRAAPQQ